MSTECNEQLRPSGRITIVDQAIAHDLDHTKYVNHQFQRLIAIDKKFTNCDFKNSEFDSAYLRKCTFDSCDFTGCKFTNSNLRGSRFIGCKFDYSQFFYTHIEPDILDSGCPGQENLQQLFARTLQLNFRQIGDTKSANKAIKIELRATRVHLHKAWRSGESYYRKKYTGLQRAQMCLKWLSFVAFDFLWGHGESPIKLLRSLLILAVLIAIGDVCFLRDINVLSSYTSALLQAPEVLLGVTSPKDFSSTVLVFIAILRYIMLAGLVSILVKRWGWR